MERVCREGGPYIIENVKLSLFNVAGTKTNQLKSIISTFGSSLVKSRKDSKHFRAQSTATRCNRLLLATSVDNCSNIV